MTDVMVNVQLNYGDLEMLQKDKHALDAIGNTLHAFAGQPRSTNATVQGLLCLELAAIFLSAACQVIALGESGRADDQLHRASYWVQDRAAEMLAEIDQSKTAPERFQ